MEKKIEIPEGVEVEKEGSTIEVRAGDSSVEKEFDHPKVDVEVEDGEVRAFTQSANRKDRAIVGTYISHIENMMEGVQEDYVYKLKTVYAHFPMTVKTEGGQVVIQNFIGERAPRRVDILPNVSVDVDDDEVTVRGPDKEKVSQTAATIEQECSKGSRDPRKFQDGIYLTKGGEQ
ncbi:MAG: 50S ribosomal protein L6 [Candidatus Nanohaloarchaea archaeon]|nr:50S ribosomal protein L6 [Candidatus Nanohaloarchaea archaeon]